MRKLLFLLFLLPGLAFSAESGIALKADNLRTEPYADAKTSGSFVKNEKVEILKKQGAWLQVKTVKATGWVRLLSIKRGTSATGGNSASSVLNVASGRAGTGQVVATTGVRGLSEDELKSAKFNEAEIKQLESYTLNANQGKSFASAAALTAIQLPYLPATGAR